MEHVARAMRPLFIASSAALLPLLALSCGDEPPAYPPLPASATGLGSGASDGSGNTGNTDGNPDGSGNTGNSDGTGDTGNTGGSSNGAGGKPSGSGNTGGSAPATGHCASPWSEPLPPPKVACDLDALKDGGEISGDISADKTLQSGNAYTLKGVVRVLPGKTLTIPPCVVIKGEDRNAVLVTLANSGVTGGESCAFAAGAATPVQAGKLVAVGEPNAPIIFTSSKPKGSRAPGDWGGVLLLGNAYNNDTANNKTEKIEGLETAECHGWYTKDFAGESSGSLAYVRIEYASRKTANDAETNGLTLASLGSGTSMHHVMVSNSNDDCFEWFGGSMNADHLVALNCDDDMFDSDQGFSGKVQFTFGRQLPTTEETDSRGFEIDGYNPEATETSTTAQWSNYTICGGGKNDHSGPNGLRTGVAMRTVAEGSLMNGFITGFNGGAVGVYSAAKTTITYSTIFNNQATYGQGHTGGTDWFANQMGNGANAPAGFCDCWANPPSPIPTKPVKGTKPTGFPDEMANYQGAFADDSPDSNWMRGLWVDWSSK